MASSSSSDQQFSEDDLIRFLLDEEVWINNAQVDALEKESSSGAGRGPSSHQLQYLRETVFPTLVPALHSMLCELNKSIVKGVPSNSGTAANNNAGSSGDCSRPCPYRSVALNGQKAQSSETFAQTATHTSALRRRALYESSTSGEAPMGIVDAITALTDRAPAESASPTPFYGPTGRTHPVEYLAQLLMRNNLFAAGGGAADGASPSSSSYATHPYVVVEKSSAQQNKPGYW